MNNIIRGLTDKELEDVSSKMNSPAVLVIAMDKEVNKNTKIGEFNLSSVGVDPNMIVFIIDFVSSILKKGNIKDLEVRKFSEKELKQIGMGVSPLPMPDGKPL